MRRYADQIILMGDGTIEAQGSFKELLENSEQFKKTMASFGQVEAKKEEPKNEPKPNEASNSALHKGKTQMAFIFISCLERGK